MMSVDSPFQFMSQLQNLRTQALGVKNESIIGGRNNSFRNEAKQSSVHFKRARHLEDDDQNGQLASGVHLCELVLNENSTENNKSKISEEAAHVLLDVGVAVAIEDLHTTN